MTFIRCMSESSTVQGAAPGARPILATLSARHQLDSLSRDGDTAGRGEDQSQSGCLFQRRILLQTRRRGKRPGLPAIAAGPNAVSTARHPSSTWEVSDSLVEYVMMRPEVAADTRNLRASSASAQARLCAPSAHASGKAGAGAGLAPRSAGEVHSLAHAACVGRTCRQTNRRAAPAHVAT